MTEWCLPPLPRAATSALIWCSSSESSVALCSLPVDTYKPNHKNEMGFKPFTLDSRFLCTILKKGSNINV